MSYLKLVSFLAVPAILAFSSPAFSQECASDTDCSEGSACMKGSSTAPCAADAPECDTTVQEDATGWCEVQPIECASDSDCDEYSACATSDSGVCWADSEGNSGCEAVAPDAPKYCQAAYVACESDSECPREFECVTYDLGCPDVACEEGMTCETPVCEPAVGGTCAPKQIECETDAECPSDWSCFGTTQYECSGGGSTGGVVDPSAPPTEVGDPAPEPGLLPPVEEEACVEIQVVGSCSPTTWGGGYYGGPLATTSDGAAESGGIPDGAPGSDNSDLSEESADSDGESDPEASGGCSVDPNGARNGGWAWMLLFVAPLFFRRRSGEVLGR